MARVTVSQLPKSQSINAKKCRYERCNGPQVTEVAVYLRGDPGRIRIRTAVTLQESGEMSKPHSRSNAFPAMSPSTVRIWIHSVRAL